MASKRLFWILLWSVGILCPAGVQAQAFSNHQAAELARRHDARGLITYTRAWMRAEPNNRDAWGWLTLGYDWTHQPGLALQVARDAERHWPDDWHPWFAMGTALYHLKRFDNAAGAFQHGLRVAPHEAQLWLGYERSFNLEPASHCKRFHYSSNPEVNAQHWLSGQGLVAHCGRPQQWFQILEEQEQIAGPYQNAYDWFRLGNSFYGDGEQADIDRVQGGYTGAARPLFILQAKAYSKSVLAYKQSIRKDPNYPYVWNNLGSAEAKLGLWRQALSAYRRASQLGDPLSNGNYQRLTKFVAFGKEVHCQILVFPGNFVGHEVCSNYFATHRVQVPGP